MTVTECSQMSWVEIYEKQTAGFYCGMQGLNGKVSKAEQLCVYDYGISRQEEMCSNEASFLNYLIMAYYSIDKLGFVYHQILPSSTWVSLQTVFRGFAVNASGKQKHVMSDVYVNYVQKSVRCVYYVVSGLFLFVCFILFLFEQWL